jgi:DNA (cytosine-5)-methyltransferase 3A
MNILSLFDGISVAKYAIEKKFKINNYFSSEIDENAIKIAKKNHPDIISLGDVTKINYDALPKIDLLIGGSPCQGFSKVGDMKGLHDERSKLFFEFIKAKEKTNPKYFLLENVVMKKSDEKIINELLGVTPILINSNLVSAQNRPRLYWTNIKVLHPPEDKNIFLYDIVQDLPFKNIGNWVYGNFGKKQRIKDMKKITDKKSNCLTTSKTHNFNYYFNHEQTQYRNLIAEEWEQLQTLPIGYTEGIPETYRHKVLGNAFTADVITHIISFMNGDEK